MLWTPLADEIIAMRRQFRQDATLRNWCVVILLLVSAVILLSIAVDLARFFDLHHARARWISMTDDRSLPEFVTYAVMALAGLSLLRANFAQPQRVFVLFGLVFLFVVFDDSMQYHERLGKFLAHKLDLQDRGPLEGQQQGELIAWALAGLALLPVAVWTLFGLTRRDVAIGFIYGLAFLALVFFAVGVDILHAATKATAIRRILGWAEDGGETLVIAGIACLAMTHARLSAAGPA
jgi:hypothetical protein